MIERSGYVKKDLLAALRNGEELPYDAVVPLNGEHE